MRLSSVEAEFRRRSIALRIKRRARNFGNLEFLAFVLFRRERGAENIFCSAGIRSKAGEFNRIK